MAKKQKPKFDWNKFLNINKKIVVHCETEKEAETFCRLMHEHGLKWGGDNPYVKRDGTVRTLWNMNIGNNKKPLNCYSNLGLHDTLEYYNKQGTPILKFSSYDFSE